jgi:hypothetical protein
MRNQRNLYLTHLQFIMKYIFFSFDKLYSDETNIGLRPQALYWVKKEKEFLTSLIYCRQLIVC